MRMWCGVERGSSRCHYSLHFVFVTVYVRGIKEHVCSKEPRPPVLSIPKFTLSCGLTELQVKLFVRCYNVECALQLTGEMYHHR